MRRRLLVLAGAALGLALTLGAAAVALWPKPLLAEVSDPLEGPRVDAPAGAPNVVVLIACTLRRDQLQLYRPELDTTPWLAELGDHGVVFDDLIAAAPWTRPASTAILTGRHPASVGMIEPLAGMNRRSLSGEVRTMPEHFRAHGWRTIGATANPNLGSAWNMHQGFDHYVEPAGTWSNGLRAKIGAGALTRRVLQQLDQAESDQPLYLQLMFIEAHAPWPDVDPAVVAADRTVPEDVHRYRAGVRRLDREVAALHGALRERGLTMENTVFVVLNDHGEGLSWPEHHGPGHGRFLAPSTVGGVWLMAGAGLPRGRRVPGVASQIDVFPTVAAAAGIPVEDSGLGHNQLPAARSGRARGGRAYSDTWFQHVSRAAVYTDTLACQQDWSQFKATAMGGFKPGCFDRATDPEHANPLPRPGLQVQLEDWRAQMLQEMAAFTGASDADPTQAILDQLEALGYVEEGEGDGVPAQ